MSSFKSELIFRKKLGDIVIIEGEWGVTLKLEVKAVFDTIVGLGHSDKVEKLVPIVGLRLLLVIFITEQQKHGLVRDISRLIALLAQPEVGIAEVVDGPVMDDIILIEAVPPALERQGQKKPEYSLRVRLFFVLRVEYLREFEKMRASEYFTATVNKSCPRAGANRYDLTKIGYTVEEIWGNRPYKGMAS